MTLSRLLVLPRWASRTVVTTHTGSLGWNPDAAGYQAMVYVLANP